MKRALGAALLAVLVAAGTQARAARAILYGESGEDLVGRGTQLSADGTKDVHIAVEGVSTPLANVTVTGGGGTWVSPYNSHNWIVGMVASGGVLHLFIAPYGATSYEVTLTYRDGKKEKLATGAAVAPPAGMGRIAGPATGTPASLVFSASSPLPQAAAPKVEAPKAVAPAPAQPAPEAKKATPALTARAILYGESGEDLVGRAQLTADGTKDVHIAVEGVSGPLANVTVSGGGGTWMSPHNGYNWIVGMVASGSVLHLFIAPYGATSYEVTLTYGDGRKQKLATGAAVAPPAGMGRIAGPASGTPASLAFAASGVTAKAPPAPTAPPPVTRLFNNWNSATVTSKPTKPTQVQFQGPTMIVQVMNYHWNDGKGVAPGTIALRDQAGRTYGPWQARATSGTGGAQNVNWIVEPHAVVPSGIYTVVDSDPGTWSQNSGSGGAGFTQVHGQPAQ